MGILGVCRVLSPVLHVRCFRTSPSISARGVRRTLKGLDVRNDEAENMTIQEMESMTNFDMNFIQNMSGHIERDAQRLKQHVNRKTIEHKYFAEKGPQEENMLTWAMKEQLRFLHSSDPDMWTPEALSHTFPISPHGVKKLLKATWTPKDAAAIEKHDQKVLTRWKKYSKGQLGNTQLLEAALKNKFGVSNERLPQPSNQEQILANLESLHYEHDEQPHVSKSLRPKNKLSKPPKMKEGSFASIIDKYEAQQQQIKTKTNTNTNRELLTDTQKRSDSISVITEGVPKYEGEYSSVLLNSESPRNKVKRRHGGKEETITFSEFMERKNKSRK